MRYPTVPTNAYILIGVDKMGRTTKEGVRRYIIDQLIKEISYTLYRASRQIRRRARDLFERVIRTSSAWQSLMHGKLAGHLGFESGYERYRLDAVLEKWLDEIYITIPPITNDGTKMKAKLTLGLLDLNYKEVLKIPEAEIISKGGIVKWLDWLLTQGNNAVVQRFHVSFNLNIVQIQYSRSKQALMFKGGQWSVPPEFAGTKTDNFATRAIIGAMDTFLDIIEEEFMKNIVDHITNPKP